MAIFLVGGCKKDAGTNTPKDYRVEMRDLVAAISSYGKAQHNGFLIVPQNGLALVTADGKSTSAAYQNYTDAIDGQAVEELYFGYDGNDNAVTPADTTAAMNGLLHILWQLNKKALVTDYCTTPANMDSAYVHCNSKGYLSFAANHRALDNIPTYPVQPRSVNTNDVNAMSDAKNYLYLINSQAYASKQAMVSAIAATDYDLVIMDLYYNSEILTASDIAQMRNKAGGGKRLLLCYMSVGEAENYRYYWQTSWNSSKPSWLETENAQWPGNYAAQYWQPQWQQILYGNDGSYLKKIINAGFDGAMLDKVDEYEYFENK